MMLRMIQIMMLMVGVLGTLSVARLADYQLITDLGTSARMIGLARIEGFDDSSSATFENPASLVGVDQSSISLFRTNLVNEFHYNNMAIAIQTPIGKIGFGYMEMVSYDLFHTATANIEGGERVVSIGNFDYKSQVYKLAYQWDMMENWVMGATYSYYQHAFSDVRGQGGNLDVGVLYQQDRYQISLMAKHIILGAHVVYNDGEQEVLPFMLNLGGRYSVTNELDLYVQGKFRDQNKAFSGRKLVPLGAIGVRYAPEMAPYLTLMGGFRQDSVLDEVRSNMTLGVELALHGFRLNYAYEKADVPGFDHKSYFSIAINY